MSWFGNTTHLLTSYGYWAVGVMIAAESLGFPIPGESILIAAAAYAGATHHLNIWWIVFAAAAGAIAGSSIAFWFGRELGYRFLLRYGGYILITERRLKFAQYLFHKHGGKIVLFGRFVAVLRSVTALLGGVNRMDWRRFMIFNVTGGVAWAALYGFGSFYFENEVKRLISPVGLALGIAAGLSAIGGFVWAWAHRSELERRVEHAFPGHLKLPGRKVLRQRR